MDEVLSLAGVSPDLQFTRLVETETGEAYRATAFEPHGVNPTLVGADRKGWGMLWNHHREEGFDYYFISNQEQFALSSEISFRMNGLVPEFWHPDTGKIEDAPVWREENGRTIVPVEFDPAGSIFVVFRNPAKNVDQVVEVTGNGNVKANMLKLEVKDSGLEAWTRFAGEWSLETDRGKTLTVSAVDIPAPVTVEGAWDVQFPLLCGTLKETEMEPGSWIDSRDEDIKYFSGTATYKKEVVIEESLLAPGQRLLLDLGYIANLARVRVNGEVLDVVWKPPYSVDITKYAVAGSNVIKVEVTNTWKNRLVKDAGLPEDKRETWVAGSRPREGSPLLPAGLLDPVRLITEVMMTPS